MTADERPRWNFKCDKIKVSTVENIGGGFWMLNKTHLCRSNSETVIFLDVDAIVLGKIEKIYEERKSDVIARCAPRVEYGYHNEREWEDRIFKYGCKNYPYLSSGFMIFKNGSHKKIKKSWEKITKKILKKEDGKVPDWHANQDAFSISCCVEELSLDLMEKKEHTYAMMGEEPGGSIVYHLGMPNFYYYYFKAEKYINVEDKRMPIARPRFLRMHRIKNRLTRKIKRKFGWTRAAKPNWTED